MSATIEVESQWQDGYCAGIRAHNGTSAGVQVTELQFTLPASVQITQTWNGTVTRSGDTVFVTMPAWVGEIPPAGSEKHFGFCAQGTTLPSDPSAQ